MMKVKVGDTIYDSEQEPVMVILDDQDKENIVNMDAEATKYAGAPTGHFKSHADFYAWMET